VFHVPITDIPILTHYIFKQAANVMILQLNGNV